MWVKVVILFTFGVTTTSESSWCVKTISGCGKHFYRPWKFCTRRCFSYKALFCQMLSYLDRLIQHQTRLPLPMTWKRVSVLSESSLINLKCNSKTNTTVTLTKSSVLWVLRGRLELHLQHLDFALDVDWHSSNIEDARWSTRCTWRGCTGWTARFARSYTALLSPIAVDQYFGALCNYSLTLENSTEQKYLQH